MRIGDRHRERIGRIGSGDVDPGSSTLSIAWTWTFSAPPVPVTAFLTSRAACSATGSPARPHAAEHRAARLGELEGRLRVVVDEHLLDRRAIRSACAPITATMASCRGASRSASGALGSVADLAVGDMGEPRPSLRTIPHPVQLTARDRGRGSTSGELLHHLVGHFVVAPHGLDVVVVLERVDQLHQRRGIALADLDA